MTHARRIASVALAAAAASVTAMACSSNASKADAGPYSFGDGSGLDVRTRDAGTRDASTRDAGTREAGQNPDATSTRHDSGLDGHVTTADTSTGTDGGAPCKGCTVLTSDTVENPQSLALDPIHVWWTQGTFDASGAPITGSGSVKGVPRTGGSTMLNTSVLTGPLILKESFGNPAEPVFVWSALGSAAGGGSVSVQQVGGPQMAAMNLTSPFGVAVDGDKVYWGSSAGGAAIQELPLTEVGAVDAGGAVTLGIAPGVLPFGMAVNTTSIYFAGQRSGGGGLFELPLLGADAGGAPTEVWTGDATSKPVDVALDATNVYWTDAGDGAVYQMPLAGGAVVTLASKGNGVVGPTRIAVDSKNVYFSDIAGSALYEVAIGATTPKALVKGLAVLGVAADDRDANVYFSSPRYVLSIAK